MEIFLVGGAVRDKLLGLEVKDRDWVVVGATPTDMIERGFRQVGADFPVFLHPKTAEEYALARTERKSGRGYHGFDVYSAPDVTLEDDLRRRDLTINAMAVDGSGRIVDPFDGQRDLADRLLRHVSPAFAEDPVRILRTARFAARFAPLGFRVAPQTADLMRRIVDQGEVDHLVPERVWQELQRALHEKEPTAFFMVLRDCHALAHLFPELSPTEVFVGAMQRLTDIARSDTPTEARFAALYATLPPEQARQRAVQLKAPNPCRDLAVLAAQISPVLASNQPLSPAQLLGLLEAGDAWRRADRFDLLRQVLHVAEPDAIHNIHRLEQAWTATQQVDVKVLLAEGYQGKELGNALRRARLAAIETALG